MTDVPANRSVRYMRVANFDTDRLLERRAWLLANRGYLATSEDVTKSDLRKRARELHAVEDQLVARGALTPAEVVFQGPVEFIPEEEWYRRRRGKGLGGGE